MLTLTTKKIRKPIEGFQVFSIHRFPTADPTEEQEADKDFEQTSPSVVLGIQYLDKDSNVIGKTRAMDLMVNHAGTGALDAALDEIEATIKAEVEAAIKAEIETP